MHWDIAIVAAQTQGQRGIDSPSSVKTRLRLILGDLDEIPLRTIPQTYDRRRVSGRVSKFEDR